MNKQNRLAPILAEHINRHEKGGFFAPIFSFFPSISGAMRTFRLWPGGARAVAPVNEARGYGNVRITPELALTLSAVWACIWRYAKTTSALPLSTMQTGNNGTATLLPTHPLFQILHNKPNANMSASSFWKGQVASMLSWGFCIAEKKYIGSKLVALDPWRPEYTTTYLDPQGQLRYRYTPAATGYPSMTQRDVSAEEVFVVLDQTMDGLSAVSRIQYGATSMGLALSADRAASLSWKNGLRASGILTIAQWLKPDQREQYKKIVNDFVGVGSGDFSDKQFGVMVAENATKFEPLSLKSVDIELLGSRKFSIEDICRWYDMPPVLIGHSAEGQTMWGSGIEQVVLGWQKLSLAPLIHSIEQEIWRQIIPPEDRANGVFAAFNLDDLMRGDSTARTAFYSSMTQNGILTRNEARAKENLPPKDGGDDLTVQSSLVLLSKLGDAAQAGDPAQVRNVLLDFLMLQDIAGAAGKSGAAPQSPFVDR